jgi:hypothetical protein
VRRGQRRQQTEGHFESIYGVYGDVLLDRVLWGYISPVAIQTPGLWRREGRRERETEQGPVKFGSSRFAAKIEREEAYPQVEA